MKLIFLFLITTSILAFENNTFKIDEPIQWNTNIKLFGSDVIFIPEMSKQDSSMFYIKTYNKNIEQKQIYSFLKNDLNNQVQNKSNPLSNLKIIKKGIIQTTAGQIKYIETTYNETQVQELQHSIIAIFPCNKKYVYFNFVSPESHFHKNWKIIKKSFASFNLK